jgi:hypothetical protein
MLLHWNASFATREGNYFVRNQFMKVALFRGHRWAIYQGDSTYPRLAI